MQSSHPIADTWRQTVATDTPLLELRPSGWNFFWHWVFFFLIIPPIIALTKRASLVLRIYPDRLTLETGLFSKRILELYITDIRTIEIEQSFMQRLLNIGTVSIDTAAPDDDELTAHGIPNPLHVRDLVQDLRRKTPRTND